MLEYVGRIDTQVKIRGYRIEPGEIETALAAHPAIADSLVIARDVAGIGKQLVAYIVTAAAAASALNGPSMPLPIWSPMTSVE